MIVFDLSCDVGHRFEGWFGSSGDYAKQCELGLVTCPQCGSGAVDKAPPEVEKFIAGSAIWASCSSTPSDPNAAIPSLAALGLTLGFAIPWRRRRR